MPKFIRAVLLSVILSVCFPVSAQILVTGGGEALTEDSVLRDFSNQPYFGLYKDNYFIFGPSVGPKANKQNTNVKFQISIAQRLTRSTLPWGTYLYLFYTQKCFWNVLENSLPMTDLNFNPGIGITKPLFVKNRYIGKLTFLVEHESNGRDSIESRSWNRVALAANVFVTKNLMVHGKIWAPIVDGENNRDIVDYCGFWQVGFQAISDNKRFIGGVTAVKRKGWNLNSNIVVDLAYRIFKRDNQYLFLQFYNGYGEGLLEYNKFHSQIRIGLLIRPKLFSDF
ncbi:MAG: phospholipase A [Muribaculaceae bacterium]|nr:phospholipase A [Muribaculaceae bacterium]MDE6574439.1 phospholipase A [Muribaculaceae bacterium]